jgi:fatty acid synthase subunit alpha
MLDGLTVKLRNLWSLWHTGRYHCTDRPCHSLGISLHGRSLASGITDPYELYKHMHPSEVGTCIGSGMGCLTSMAQMFKDRRDEKRAQNDILQEM